jgi:hypothetical protein
LKPFGGTLVPQSDNINLFSSALKVDVEDSRNSQNQDFLDTLTDVVLT